MIISFPEKLVYVRVLTTKDLRDKAISALQEAGIMHLEPIGDIPEEDKEALKKKASKLKELINIVEAVESLYEKPRIVEILQDIDLMTLDEKLEKALDLLSEKHEQINNLLNNIEKISRELQYSRRLMRSLSALIPDIGDFKLRDISYDGNLLFSLIGRGKAASVLNLLNSLPKDTVIVKQASIEDELVFVIAGLKFQKQEVISLIRKNKIEILSPPDSEKTVREFINELKTKIEELEETLSKLRNNLKSMLDDVASDIALAKLIHRIYSEKIDALLNALAGDFLAGIEGWVPEQGLQLLHSVLNSNVKQYFVSKIDTAKEPPTKLKNKKPFKPFELITRLYGVPSKSEWDPTPIIMYSFMIFFGTMFADFVYGILMFILVKFALDRTGLIDNPYSEGYVTLKKMLLTLAISSTIFGALSNTFAGFSFVQTVNGWGFVLTGHNEVAPAILNFTDPIWFLVYALLIGLVHINISHALSLVRGVKEKDIGRVINEIGIFVAEIFGIPYVFHTTMHYDIIPFTDELLNIFLYGTIAGVAMIILGNMKSSGGLGILMWIFNIAGLLGDVLSYSRLAGLGLATYLMAKSFNGLSIEIMTSMSGMFPVVGVIIGIVAAALVMLVMNLINMIFGIIGAFVHSLRLCFVEFLPKWYEGTGREFTPFAAKIERHVVVGRGF